MKKIYVMLLLAFIFRTAAAQPICGFDLPQRQQLHTDPAFKARVEQLDKQWMQLAALKKNTASRLVVEGADTIYEIPTVIHVLNTGGAVGTDYNRSDAELIAWIDYLNEVFEATWPGHPGVGSGGVKIPIRFVLAKRDPDCAATTGIVRVDASSVIGYTDDGLAYGAGGTGALEDDLKALSRWPPQLYYNIYVVNKINGEDGYTTIGSFIAGYAYFAGTGPANDGSFMLSYVAEEGASTLPHEMGHAMGLYHTFQGADPSGGSCAATETDCATEGDLICDTEFSPSNLSDFPCPTASDVNMCTGAFYEGVQNNIMNYGYCLDRFTEGQRDRMMMQLLAYRISLLNSLATEAPGGSDPSADPATCATTAITDPGNAFNMGPCNVSFNTIAYTSGGYSTDDDEFYIDHTEDLCIDGGIITTVMSGEDYDLEVSVRTNPQNIKTYIDYNNDGTFDPVDEIVMDIASAPANSTQTATVSIPDTTVFDTPLRMRVMSDFSGSADFGPCDDLDYGQSEDFAVIIQESMPLPVILAGFNASAASCSVNLSWNATEVKDLLQFEVERSTDGRRFSKIAEIAYNDGERQYTWQDEGLGSGNYFYRLRMQDKNGAYQYSVVRQVPVSCYGRSAVYPNPFANAVTVDYNAAGQNAVTIAVYNITGRLLFSKAHTIHDGINSLQVDMSAFVDGLYVLHVFNNYGHEAFKVVKRSE